eukprot:10084016-Alexandrium_andersonii.AAC.1
MAAWRRRRVRDRRRLAVALLYRGRGCPASPYLDRARGCRGPQAHRRVSKHDRPEVWGLAR